MPVSSIPFLACLSHEICLDSLWTKSDIRSADIIPPVLFYCRNSEVKNYKFIKTENILTKTKSKMISLQSSTFICVVLIAFCSFARSDESGHNVDATSDYYAQYYQDFYNNLAGKTREHIAFF